MFNLFGKKKEEPKQLVFKTNVAAFEHACKFLKTDLTTRDPVTAIVLETRDGSDCVVKVANKEDASIPDELLAKGLIKFICPTAKATDRVPALSKGDLVIIVDSLGLSAMGQPLFASILVAKLRPIFDFNAGGWVVWH
jgi:hypothetical protein